MIYIHRVLKINPFNAVIASPMQLNNLFGLNSSVASSPIGEDYRTRVNILFNKSSEFFLRACFYDLESHLLGIGIKSFGCADYSDFHGGIVVAVLLLPMSLSNQCFVNFYNDVLPTDF